ncbi:MAG: histidinol-phosphatase [Thermoleophilia bacterium]
MSGSLGRMLTDYHMHTQPDGVGARADGAERWDAHGGPWSAGWLAAYVAAAAARGVDEIAMTEHVYRFREAADWHDDVFWREEATASLDEYVGGVAAARDEGLPVLLGIEMDWLPHRTDEIRALLDRTPFDVVLGSVHWIGATPVDNPNDPPRLDAHDLWEAYLDAVIAAAESGLFDVLAHVDLAKIFGLRAPDSVAGRVDELVERVAAAGVAIECSTAGLRKPVGELYPDPDLLARFQAAGVPVTLSSDAHRPEDVGRDYPTAVAALRGAGYSTITRFAERAPEQVEFAPWM